MEACVGAHHLSRKVKGPWSRCPADVGEVRPPVFEGTEKRLPRRGDDRRGRGLAPWTADFLADSFRAIGLARPMPRPLLLRPSVLWPHEPIGNGYLKLSLFRARLLFIQRHRVRGISAATIPRDYTLNPIITLSPI